MSKGKKEKGGLVPELRFKEFGGAWELNKFSRHIKLYRGSSPRPISKFITEDEDGVNWIKIGDTKYTRNFVLSEISEKITHEGAEKSRRVTKGELILANSMSYGATYKLDIEGCIYDGWFVLRKYKSSFNKEYLLQLLNSSYVQQQYSRLAAGGIVKNISSEIVYNTLLPKPSKAEQQKIAKTLTSLDDLITAQVDKLAALRAHKQGLLQRLFPGAGERVPEVRFREFLGEWEMEPFESIYSTKVTNSFSRNKLNYDQGEVYNIHYGDIHTKFSTLFDVLKEDIPFINNDVAIDRIDNDNYCLEGDLVIADASEDMNDIGKSIEIINTAESKILAGLHTILARQIDKKMITGFAGHLFTSRFLRDQMKNEAQGAKVLGISKSRISNIIVPYPLSEKEQQKIASILSSLDDIITAQSEKIDILREHKRGLLQRMFPRPNAVSR